MAITTNCSGCGKTLAVADEFAGRQARCPACGQIYTVPASTTPIAPTPAAPSSFDAPLDLQLPSQSSAFGGSTPSAPLSTPVSTPLSTPASASAAPSGSEFKPSSVQYWMRASNGAEYGPADAAMLSRWFTEGRIGPDYQIRIGQYGHWQPAAAFQSLVTGQGSATDSNVNPYATSSTFTPGVATHRTYPKADQSGLVLAMGILSWVGGCAIFGIIAWVVGSQALADINAGNADPSSRGVVQVGYYLGMVNVILSVMCLGLFMLSIILSAM